MNVQQGYLKEPTRRDTPTIGEVLNFYCQEKGNIQKPYEFDTHTKTAIYMGVLN